MDVMKLLDQVNTIKARYEAVREQAKTLLDSYNALSISDKQKLYTILNALGTTQEFEASLEFLKSFVESK